MEHTPGPIRAFQKYTSEQRAKRLSSHTQGHRQRESIGEFFWYDDRIPGVCFPTRKRCLEAIKQAGVK